MEDKRRWWHTNWCHQRLLLNTYMAPHLNAPFNSNLGLFWCHIFLQVLSERCLLFTALWGFVRVDSAAAYRVTCWVGVVPFWFYWNSKYVCFFLWKQLCKARRRNTHRTCWGTHRDYDMEIRGGESNFSKKQETTTYTWAKTCAYTYLYISIHRYCTSQRVRFHSQCLTNQCRQTWSWV